MLARVRARAIIMVLRHNSRRRPFSSNSLVFRVRHAERLKEGRGRGAHTRIPYR
jgi:hypothetical protein